MIGAHSPDFGAYSSYTEASSAFQEAGITGLTGWQIGPQQQFASPAPMRFAIASVFWRRQRPSSARAARTQVWSGGKTSRRRHRDALPSFPDPGVAVRAVYRREVQQLVELAEQLKSEAAPVDALRRWLRSNVEFVATKKGMLAALALTVHGSSELYAHTFDRLTKAVGALLDRAVAAGEIRSDISPEDLLRALVGMCYMHDQPGWQKSVLRLVDVFVDGLRVQSRVDGTSTLAPYRDDPPARKHRRRGSPDGSG